MTSRAQDSMVGAIGLLSIVLIGNLFHDAWQGRAVVEWEGTRRAPPTFELDIQHATVEELCLLPKIGPELARRIVEARSTGQRLESPDDLLAIRGIGPKKLAGLRSLVYFTGPKGADLAGLGSSSVDGPRNR